MPLPASARAFLLAVVTGAIALAGVTVFELHAGPPNVVLVVAFTVAGAVAGLFPVALSPRVKFTVDTSVYFAALLLFPTAWAIFVVAAGALGSGLGTTAFKGRGAGGRTLRSTAFNASQLVLAVGAASLVYTELAGGVGSSALASQSVVWSVPTAALVMYLVNTLLVSVLVALQRRQPVSLVWRSAQRVAVLQFGALFIIGLGTALLTVHYTWGLLLMAIPLAVVFVALQKTVELMSQTVSAVEAMADVVDAADPYTYEHSKRVAEYASLIARELGLPARVVEEIRQAARVHDLGKVGVPGEILRKPGRLDAEERCAMQAHVLHGYQILSRFPEYRDGRELILRHHERYDGKGYPHGILGSALPMQAQVMPVADALDAMTTDRPYRRAMTLEEALAELMRGAGSQWHPDVVAAANQVLAPRVAAVRALTPSPA